MPSRPRAAAVEPEYDVPPTPSSVGSGARNPAAALAGIIQQRTGPSSPTTRRSLASPPPLEIARRRPQYTPEGSDEDPPSPPAPHLPQRPPSQQLSPPVSQYASPRAPESAGVMPSPPYNRAVSREYDEDQPTSSLGGFHLYNIHEMVSHNGKNKKMPMTLGINIARGLIMIAPEKSRDGPQREWSAEKLTHYSIEGKHVFMELVRPSKSADIHAGAKDTAKEIVSALGELAGAARAEGLREVLAAGAGTSTFQKKGHMLYEFMAQGDDEVTVAVGDDVIVLDDTKSDEWWMVRRLKNGKEGVVPSSYVEITDTSMASPSISGLNAARSTVEQNRLEEERMAKQASKGHKRRDSDSKGAEVGPSLSLTERGSSLVRRIDTRMSSQRSKRDSRSDARAPSTSKPSRQLKSGIGEYAYTNSVFTEPDSSKVRTWTDRSGSFKVDAEFIGLRDGKIHLHKQNGVKIAVPVTKMAVEDLEYVEKVTGVSLDEDKPLSDIKRRNTQRAKERRREDPAPSSSRPKAGAAVENPKKLEYDWFDFFLQCGVNPQICERYANAFNRDQMGQEILPDVQPQLLRTLGLKEGDILRVMKFLDNKYGRTATREPRKVGFADNDAAAGSTAYDANGSAGGLFSGPGGALKNNTRKGRPAPAVQTNDVVDIKALESPSEASSRRAPPSESTATPLASIPAPPKKGFDGFDDDAWDVKPTRQAQAPAPASTPAFQAPPQAPTPAPPPATVTGSMAELSLLSPPLQPTQASQPAPQPAPQTQIPFTSSQQQPQPTGADPSFFNRLAAPAPQQSLQPQQPASRQRPQAPLQIPSQASLIAPPPQRAGSAPLNYAQQSAFGPPPLQPQLTGYNAQNGMNQRQLAPPGQSLQELNQQRFQQQQQQQFAQQQMQSQPTGYGQPPQSVGFGQQQQPGFDQLQNGMMSQPTGFGQFSQQQPQQTGYGQFQQPQPTGFQPSTQQQFINGQQTGSPFADPPRPPFQPQPTGMQSTFAPMQSQQTGINSFLPPPLQPQATGFTNGFNPQQTGFANQRTGFAGNAGFGQAPPPVPPMPQQQTLTPLVPQKTGPAPPVRFGVTPGAANKLQPQATGRRANLGNATPQNPFGF
ncbi:hypothetical protein LTR16_002221 [Cryomyces antarcticus]|uniref:Actin cytoskeleton-regulatory complex protein SLA1 n=1 Tax=Cryomyces antarcticus TaxID=329879 RepID=A0ABR0M810_9PEZI|nr:hypothetical protein LTR16_002221 [Cryomyces antarcticus]